MHFSFNVNMYTNAPLINIIWVFFSFYKDWIMIYSKIDVTIFEMIIMGFACYGRVICTLSHEQIYMAVGLKYVYFWIVVPDMHYDESLYFTYLTIMSSFLFIMYMSHIVWLLLFLYFHSHKVYLIHILYIIIVNKEDVIKIIKYSFLSSILHIRSTKWMIWTRL